MKTFDNHFALLIWALSGCDGGSAAQILAQCLGFLIGPGVPANTSAFPFNADIDVTPAALGQVHLDASWSW